MECQSLFSGKNIINLFSEIAEGLRNYINIFPGMLIMNGYDFRDGEKPVMNETYSTVSTKFYTNYFYLFYSLTFTTLLADSADDKLITLFFFSPRK